jgi:hemerythrin
MSYEWPGDLEIGYPAIDDQHKLLIESLNDLLWTCQHGGHRDELKKTVNFLVSYTEKHFTDEQELHRKYNYPDRERHKGLHESFKLVVSDLAERLVEDGPSIGLVAEVKSAIGDWLISHIKGEDPKFVSHALRQA